MLPNARRDGSGALRFDVCSPRVAAVLDYIYRCAVDYVDHDRCDAEEEPGKHAGAPEVYDVPPADGPVSIEAHLVSLPERGGTFPVCDYVGPELAAFGHAEPSALEDPLVAELAVIAARSCHRAEPEEYAAVLARMHAAEMLELTSQRAPHPLGLFGVWKTVGEKLRLIVDGRPGNCFFRAPEYEHTGGDSLARIQSSTRKGSKTAAESTAAVDASPPGLPSGSSADSSAAMALTYLSKSLMADSRSGTMPIFFFMASSTRSASCTSSSSTLTLPASWASDTDTT